MMQEAQPPDSDADDTNMEEVDGSGGIEEVEGSDNYPDTAERIKDEHDETGISEQETQLIEAFTEDEYQDDETSIMVHNVEINDETETYEDTQQVEEEVEPATQPIQQSYIFKCDLCQNKFADQFGFFEHLRTHYDSSGSRSASAPAKPKEAPLPIPPENDEEPNASTNPSPENLRERLKILKERRKTSEKLNDLLPTAAAATERDSEIDLLNCCEEGCEEAFTSRKAQKLHVISAHTPKESPRYETRATVKSEVSSPSKVSRNPAEVDHFMMDFKEEIDSEENSDEGEELPEEEEEEEVDVYEPEDEEEQPTRVKRKESPSKKRKLKEDEILCPDCGEFFETLAKLKAHKKLNHSDEFQLKKGVGGKSGRRTRGTALQCKVCSKVFNHKNSLVYHMKGHTGERNYECTDCGKKFLTSSALNVHNRLHTGEKPYKCEHCLKPFRQWGDLAYHIVSLHSNVRAFVCEFCGKDFARKYSLTVHRRIHTLERDYACEFCSKSFRAASYLQSHRRIHTGEKPHNCDVCGKPFRVKSDMRRHRQSHNRSEKSRSRKEVVGEVLPNPILIPITRASNHNKVQSRPQEQELHLSKVEQEEPEVLVHNLVAVDESGRIIELEPRIAQQLRAGQVIQVPMAGSSGGSVSTRRITIEDAGGSLITGDLDSHELNEEDQDQEEQDEEEMKGEEEQEVPVEYLQHADIVLTSESAQDPTQGSLYVWPVFMS